MSGHLPNSINPARLAKSGASVDLAWPKGQVTRILEIAEAVNRDIELKLMFKRDISGEILIEGHISAELEFICQRCLCPFNWEVDEPIRLIVSQDGEAEPAQKDEYEVLQVDEDGNFNMQQLVENEIIVRVPTILMHAHLGDCDQQMLKRCREFDAEELEKQADNPFAILKQLK